MPFGSRYGNALLDPSHLLTETNMVVHLWSCLGMENPTDRAVHKPAGVCWPFIHYPELRAAVPWSADTSPGGALPEPRLRPTFGVLVIFVRSIYILDFPVASYFDLCCSRPYRRLLHTSVSWRFLVFPPYPPLLSLPINRIRLPRLFALTPVPAAAMSE
jgi:hypothetical protein